MKVFAGVLILPFTGLKDPVWLGWVAWLLYAGATLWLIQDKITDREAMIVSFLTLVSVSGLTGLSCSGMSQNAASESLRSVLTNAAIFALSFLIVLIKSYLASNKDKS
jgi:hypothetical protein